MQYDIKAIPQMYSGVQFRSRLEASWAAFFDIVGIAWEYEPFELDGWFPDFRISTPPHAGSLLVEVKPTDFGKDINDTVKKIMVAVDGKEILLLGNSPRGILHEEESSIGLLFNLTDSYPDPFGGMYPRMQNMDSAVLNHGPDLSAYYGSYAFRFSGKHNGDQHLLPVGNCFIKDAWKLARNKTQWVKHG